MFASAAYHTVLPVMPTQDEWHAVAQTVYPRVLRTDFTTPGFALLTFLSPPESTALRGGMIRLKEALNALFLERSGRHLVYRSMARFDQQVSTKFHIDGGPVESLLMLGYEPSAVESRIAMADYTLVSWKMGIAPSQSLVDHNPMFTAGAKLLEPFTTLLTAFDPATAQILLINNSCKAPDTAGRNLLGVMHQATIAQPDATCRRVINSTMIVVADNASAEAVSREQQAEYATSDKISAGNNYVPSE